MSNIVCPRCGMGRGHPPVSAADEQNQFLSVTLDDRSSTAGFECRSCGAVFGVTPAPETPRGTTNIMKPAPASPSTPPKTEE